MKPPPEERLLRLIRGKAPQAAPAAAGGQGTATPAAGPGRKAPATLQIADVPWTRLAAVALGIVLAIEGGCVMLELTRPLPQVTALSTPEDGGEGDASALPPEPPSLSETVSRQLFDAPAAGDGSGPAQPAVKSGPSASGKLLASRLSLMGIVAGDPGQAIIEDTQTKKTYFVTAGQTVVDGATLTQVLDNRVILDLDGESIELSL